MVIAEQTLYLGSLVFVFLGAAVTAVFARQFAGVARRHVMVLPLLLVVLAVGYTAMALELLVATSPEGEPVYFTRFGAYLITYSTLVGYIGLVAGADRRYRLFLPIVVVGFTIGGLLSQLTAPPVETLGSLILVGSLVAVVWVLFGPLTRAATQVSGERQLLFAKLRNLALLIFVMYLLVGLTNRAALGLLDAFIGVFTTTYVDLIGHFGLVAIIVYSQAAVEDVAAEHSSLLHIFTDS